jgi:hypothetical protein
MTAAAPDANREHKNFVFAMLFDVSQIPDFQSTSKAKKPFFVTLTLILTEYAGFSPAYIYEAEGFV